MKMSQLQQDTVIEKLNALFGPRKCPVCDSTKWNLDDALFELVEFEDSGTLVASRRVKPLVALTCSNCGNTVTLNAIQLGVLPAQVNDETKGGANE